MDIKITHRVSQEAFAHLRVKALGKHIAQSKLLEIAILKIK